MTTLTIDAQSIDEFREQFTQAISSDRAMVRNSDNGQIAVCIGRGDMQTIEDLRAILVRRALVQL